MKRLVLLLALVGAVLAARPALGAGTLDIDAPGGFWLEQDGTIGAAGTAAKPLVVVLDDYEISARSLRYDPRKQSGEATGDVRWRDRRPGANREIGADIIAFALTSQTMRAQGNVDIKEQGINLRAEIAQVDLAKKSFHLTGDPAQAAYGRYEVQAGQITYDSLRGLVAAEGNVRWHQQAGPEGWTVNASRMGCDLSARTAEAAGGVSITAGELRMTAERLSYDEGSDRCALVGQPTATRGSLRLAAALLTWQPALDSIVATGGATFTDPPFAGTSDGLRYMARENKVYLTGAVRLIRGQDVLTGTEIVCDLTTRQVRVMGQAKAVITLEG